ncbi:hypothetical protein [Leisingera caerulea]|uniref:hypothetical protein n=1 Tax=Leisingera caerulea TaxID=506591 RepID=UPI00048A2377|nr:hypothetical protein [Leisingera caerulea]
MNKFAQAVACCMVLAGGALPAAAQNMLPIQVGERVKIDKHGTCRIVENDGNTRIMAPVRSAPEWSNGSGAFTRNIADMDRVKLHDCNWVGTRGGAPTIYVKEGSTTYYTWNNGSKTPIAQGYWMGYSMRIPQATFFNPDTGQCAPARSWISKSATKTLTAEKVWSGQFSVQLCEADRMATGPHTAYNPPPTGTYPGP